MTVELFLRSYKMPYEHTLMVTLQNMNFRSLVPKTMGVLCCFIKTIGHVNNIGQILLIVLDIATSQIDFTTKVSMIMYVIIEK